MNKARDIKNPYDLPRVVLASISDEIQLDENLEPPFVRVRDTNSQYMHLENSQNVAGNYPYDVNITLDRSLPRINRLSFIHFSFRNFAPNINTRNNSFSFIAGGVSYTATMVADQNLLGLARYQALCLAMNAATGNPGEFTVAAGTLFQTYVITNNLPRTWRFTYVSNGVKKGRYLWGINSLNYSPGTEALSHTLTYFQENYSRFVDLRSYELTQYTKTDISGTNIGSEVIFRDYIDDIAYGEYRVDRVINNVSLNYDRSRGIAVCDMQLLDEFGELYYCPVLNYPSAIFQIVLIASM